MPSTNQLTIPQNYVDVLHPKLLVQPEPQYLYARWLLSAFAQSLPVPSDIGLAGRMVEPKGAPYSSLEDNQLILSEPIGPELFAVAVNLLGSPGTNVRTNRPKFSDTTYTAASRKLNANSSISTTGIAISSEQTNITLAEYGGPYDADNSRVAPYSVDKFAAQNGMHNLVEAIGTHHKRDFHKFLDAWVAATLDQTSKIAYSDPTNMTSDDSATSKGQFPVTYASIVRLSRLMDDAKLPRLPDGRRVLVLTPTGSEQLGLDRGFQRQAKYFEAFNTLFAGTYVSSIPQFHIFYSQTLATVANTGGIYIHRAHAIAPGALGAGMGLPPEIRTSTNDDFQRSVLSAWIAYLALELLDERFCYSFRYTEGE